MLRSINSFDFVIKPESCALQPTSNCAKRTSLSYYLIARTPSKIKTNGKRLTVIVLHWYDKNIRYFKAFFTFSITEKESLQKEITPVDFCWRQIYKVQQEYKENTTQFRWMRIISSSCLVLKDAPVLKANRHVFMFLKFYINGGCFQWNKLLRGFLLLQHWLK